MSDTELTSSPHSRLSLAILSILGLLLIAAFAALGTWQLKRLSWKLDLIARVEERVHAAPMPVPPRNDWPNVNAARDEYRHVALQGRFLNDKETLVYAATERGAGYWVVTPLAAADGTTVLVNRGFVPTERREASTRREGQIEGEAKVTGLMRMDEPDGSLLQSNRPGENRWYSRDVGAIAAARGLSEVAPYFVDADASPNRGGLPVGGLTRVVFPTNHLAYAVTWYGLAAMTVGMLVILWRSARRSVPARRNGRAGEDINSRS
ncbi:SURF1 family protein [Sinorhizobium meliloti]|nr:SURF1 family protein [Sinorhizobium meliloti]MDW9745310.1 SURF1 family protein [Sinorhizobium meliloti]MDW9819698.1 SURF1 family protein [Sinorhizobium meliloti]MDX0265984.1 SURF1 family protein [Sinorhizobium meliloti]MDX0353006.1 SURF1 family protein [Sinorhizobium meliloti]